MVLHLLPFSLYSNSMGIDYYLSFINKENKAWRNDVSSLSVRGTLNSGLSDFLPIHKCF